MPTSRHWPSGKPRPYSSSLIIHSSLFTSFFILNKSRALIVVFVASWLVTTMGAQSVQPLRVMTWNVENLFDTVHDEGFQDEEFLPRSERRWTRHRYWQKMTDVSRVIAAVAEEGGVPDLVGLCEVENDSVLHTLTRRSILRQLGYEYVMTHSEDARGIDVALLYQPVHFRLLEAQDIRVPSREAGLPATRDILYAKGLVLAEKGIDTLHVMVVHLPSRAGGHTGDRNRNLAARTLWNAVESIMAQGGGAQVVVMGDFNAGRRDKVFKRAPLRLTDDTHSPGTYCYRGFWQWLDHILVSPSVQTRGPARALRLPWLLEENKTYGGDMPFRTYRGPTYHGGVSDHLPVVLDLVF